MKHEIELLDVIVLLPLDEIDSDVISGAEDRELKIAVDDGLIDILCGDALNIFSFYRPMILEIRGFHRGAFATDRKPTKFTAVNQNINLRLSENFRYLMSA